jgi:putative transcriptional regulator
MNVVRLRENRCMRGSPVQFNLIAVVFCILFLFGPNLSAVQYSGEPELAVGTILVANAKLTDPNFAQTVILIVQFDDENGAVGLVLNRRTELSITGIFPNSKHATKDPVYMGGPVDIRSAQALLRLAEKTDQATRVIGDVYVSGAKELIDKSINSQTDPSKFRLYLGYAGWAAGQLQAEMRVGAWSLVNGSSRIIFDPHPESLWARLSHDAQMRLASAPWPEIVHGWFVEIPSFITPATKCQYPEFLQAMRTNANY